jgi:uncharacterized membrane protein
MNNLKRLLILLFAAFFLVTGIISVNHYHSEGVFQSKDKDHCSICAFVFTLTNAILILFLFSVIFSAVYEQIIKRVFAHVKSSCFLPPSLAPPVFA